MAQRLQAGMRVAGGRVRREKAAQWEPGARAGPDGDWARGGQVG